MIKEGRLAYAYMIFQSNVQASLAILIQMPRILKDINKYNLTTIVVVINIIWFDDTWFGIIYCLGQIGSSAVFL